MSFTYTPTGKYATCSDASQAAPPPTATTAWTDSSRKPRPRGTLNYTYDAASHVASIASSNANGALMTYTYDDLNRLRTVTDNRSILKK